LGMSMSSASVFSPAGGAVELPPHSVERPPRPTWPSPRPATIVAGGKWGRSIYTLLRRLLAGGAAISHRRESEERMGFGPHPPRRSLYMRVFWRFRLWPGYFFRARPPIRVWSGPKNGRSAHIGPPPRLQADIGDLLEMLLVGRAHRPHRRSAATVLLTPLCSVIL
jgi:hypothetical protein